MADELKLLPPFTWRGIQYPVTDRTKSFAHESVQHKLQRRNQDLVEQTGAHNAVLTYSIPMRESLFKGPYQHLFTEGLQGILDDCRDRSPGDLFDPVYGYLRCVPSSYNDELSALRRDGVDLRIEFRHSPEEEDDDIVVTPVSAITESESLAVEAQEFQVTAEEAEEIAPNTSVRLKDMLSGLATTGRRVLATPNDIRSEMNQIKFFAKEIEDITYEATSPEAIATRHRARETRDKAQRVLDNALLIRPVRTRITNTTMSLASLAASFNVPFEAFLRANSALARLPSVPPGTTVTIPDVG